MKCELCAIELPESEKECSICSAPEIKQQIQDLIERAIEILKEKGNLESDANLCFELGHYYQLSARVDEAIRYYDKAVSLMSEKPKYLHALGTALAMKEDYDLAIPNLEKAVKLVDQYPDYHNDLGAAYFKVSKFEEAISEFQKSLELNNCYANAHNNLGLAYRKKGDHKKADDEIREAIKIDPEHQVAAYELGLSYYNGGMFSRQKSYHQIDAKGVGDLYFTQANYEKALEYYQKALGLHPKYADYHFVLGLTYEAMGQINEARASFQEALNINPNYQDAKSALENLKEGKNDS